MTELIIATWLGIPAAVAVSAGLYKLKQKF
jgi:hypothetical protein